ncbi:MAG TPA: HAD hydrolase family protein [Candidatus Gallacutalibacter stercoravium]|nr:HAD hydrolase family protein [Candidatus Gallacutalibacter stercoravium]
MIWTAHYFDRTSLFPISEVAAFGNDQNDLEMIQNCGYGVATENATP